ncbi:HNH endonuclease family protein, partial [Candidatus Poseidoniales archaeon]|nr:HNH endonuclease family protein [Candidatus Poseidoniales archaeon]
VLTSRLGNMCLLLDSDNISISNHGFETKKEAYARSSLALTKDLIENDNWGAEEVNERQSALFSNMLEVWNIDNL